MSATSAATLPAPAARRQDAFAVRFARNRGAVAGALVLLLVALVAAGADWLYPVNPLRIVGAPEIWPFESWRYPLGTDSMGRDIAALIAQIGRASCRERV